MQLVRSSDLSHLAGCLCRLLEEPGPALLEPEIILIQSAGMERWLSRELAQRRGVAANLHFPFPRAFIHQVLDEVLGADPAVARYERRALVWELFSLLGQASDDPAFAFVARNLAHDSDGSQRFRLARELTDLFDQYLTYRPQMMLRWAAGKGATKRDQQEPGGNGRGADGASPLDFQAEIFRRVVARLGPFHLAERLRRFLREVEPSQLRKSLPSRLTLVGGAGLPPVYLRVLSRIAEVIPVTVLSFQVCGEYFADLHPTEEALPELGEGAHPLLVSLGKVGADFQQLLEMSGNYTELGAAFPRRNPGTLLSELQNDILSGNQRPSTELLPAALLADGSISVDVCHSPLREVEILADRLLSWFKQDPTLAPEDVVVLSPDIEAYSPLISAVFAARGEHGPKLPFRIFDRSEGAINPVAKVLLVGLPLLTGRFKLSALLDFLQLEPVQARFELSPVDLERVADWLRKVGVRWGADAEHVQSFGITSDGAHTLTWGLRRLLLGYACADEGDLLCQGLVPEDDVPAGDGELLGRFAEFTRQLLGFRDEVLRGPRPPSEWFDLILAFLDAFVAQGTGANWESQSVRQVVFGLRQHADWAEVSESIGLAPLSRLLAGELEVQRSSADFLSGGITFCALLPLRTIPFRKICVLGLDQDRFPRADEPSNLSWLFHEPRIGDRSLRADDRFLFLELLVAASETLALSYVGRSVQDNTECPASVVVFELLSVLTNMVESEAAGQVPKFPLRIHPLQPFSPRYFVAGGELTSFSTSAFEGARALVAQGTGAPREISRFLDEPVQPFGGKSELQVSMGEFLRFYKNPARAYLATLGVHLDDEIEQFEDREPVGADPLSRFGLGDSLVRQLARHEPLLERVHLARGQLPPASAGRLVLAEISAHAERVLEAARPFLGSGEREAVELAIPLAGKLSDGRLVSGVLGGQLELLAQTHLQMGYGEPTPKRKLSLWIEHLALCASGYEARSVLIGRAPSNAAQVNAWLAPPVAKSWAQARLGELFQDYLLGHEMPLLFFPDASEALAERHAKLGLGEFGERPEDDHEALAAAHKKVGRQGNLPGELLQLYRGVTPVLGLSLEDQASFYNLSLRVFRPLLEQLTRLDLSGENPS